MEPPLVKQLPEELLMLVLARLPWQDKFRLRAVCRRWSAILRDANFLRLSSPSSGVPLFLSSAFPESDLTLYLRPGAHKCMLEGKFCSDCDFQFFSPQGDRWSIFPRTWFNMFLHGGLGSTCTRFVRVVAVKGGVFMIFFRRQQPKPSLGTERCRSSEHRGRATCPACPSKQKSEIIYLVNPFTQSHRLLNLPLHLKEKGPALFWAKVKKLVDNRPRDAFQVLLGPWFEKCAKHERCDVWTLDAYDVGRDAWSQFQFHLGRTMTVGEGASQQLVDVGFVYDATIVRDALFFVTCHSDSLFSAWRFCPDAGSLFPSRLADIPVLNVYKPSVYERQGRLVLLGQSFDMNQYDFSIRLWEYDSADCRWIPVMSFLGDIAKACWNLKGDFGQDFACVSVELVRRSEYFVCNLSSGTCQTLPALSAGRKLFMLEPRLDMQL